MSKFDPARKYLVEAIHREINSKPPAVIVEAIRKVVCTKLMPFYLLVKLLAEIETQSEKTKEGE